MNVGFWLRIAALIVVGALVAVGVSHQSMVDVVAAAVLMWLASRALM